MISTFNPADPLNVADPGEELFYGPMSGTSMSCPVTADCATLVVDAYVENHGEYPDSMDVLTTLEAAVVEDVHDGYTAESVGAGYVDALTTVERAEAGDLAGFDEIDAAPGSHE